MLQSKEDLEQWAEDHGYWSGICPVHGLFWRADGSNCPNCPDPGSNSTIGLLSQNGISC